MVALLDEATQRTLLTEPDLNFNKAVSIASARETAAEDVREMGRRPTVYNIQPSTGARNKPSPKGTGHAVPGPSIPYSG